MARINVASVDRMDWIALALLLSVSAVVAHGYFFREEMPYFEGHFGFHKQVIDGTAPSPYRYRILVPFLTEAMSKAFSSFLDQRRSFLLAYAIYDLSSIFFSLTMLFLYLRLWFPRDQSLIGTLFVGATMSVALIYFQPWSLIEPGLFALGLLFIRKNWYWLLCPLIALATLNRETALFIPLAFLVINLDAGSTHKKNAIAWKPLIMFSGYLFIWLAVFIYLRLYLGIAPDVLTLKEIFELNTRPLNLFTAGVNVSLFLGLFWLFAILGFRHAPTFCRRAAWIVPPYLLTVLIWGVWYEVRLLMTLYPIIIPLGLSFIYRRSGTIHGT